MRWLVLVALGGCQLVFPYESDTNAALPVVVDGEGGITELVVVGDELMWSTDLSSTGVIRRCEIAACIPQDVLEDQPAPRAIEVRGEFVLWASGDILRSRRLEGGTVNDVEFGFGQVITDFDHVGDRLFMAKQGMGRCIYNDDTGTCASFSNLPAFEGVRAPLTTDTDGVLWGGGKEVVAMSVAVFNEEEVIKRFPFAAARALVTASGYLFAIDEGAESIAAWELDAPDGSPPTATFEVGGLLLAFAATPSHVYAADARGRIVRIAVAPELGAVEDFATGLPPVQAIAIRADELYVAIDSGIVVLPIR